MRKLMIAFMFLFCGFQSTDCFGQQRLDGKWIGGFKIGQKWVSVATDFKTENEMILATIDIPSERIAKQALTRVRFNSPQVTFAIEKDGRSLTFAGRLREGKIIGEYQEGDARRPFELLRVTNLEARNLSRYAGSYRLGNNKFVWIGVDGGSLSFGESEEGRGGGLIALSETAFVAGPSIGANYPIDLKATFVKDAQGEISSLKWQPADRSETVAQRVKVREEEVKFSNGNITLAGTLVLPPTKGPHPALVLVTGSGPALRDQFGGFPHLFASIGVATLIYDKRGCGASTGTFNDSLPIEELAADTLSGVEYLKTRPDIDPRQIGLRGDSQGAWVVPYAAGQSSAVSFVIVKSASALNTWENGLYEMENDLRLAGFSESDIAKARSIGTLFNQMLFNRGEGWAQLRSAIERDRNEKWFSMARVPDSLPETPAAANLRWVEREKKTLFDPQPYWEKLKVPVLLVNGGLDRNIPGKESAGSIEMSLKKAQNQDYTISFYPNADHHLWVVERMGQREGRSKQVGVYGPMLKWLLDHTRAAK